MSTDNSFPGRSFHGTMYRSLWAFLFILAPLSIWAQTLDPLTSPGREPDMPEWAELLYREPIDVRRLDSAYMAYYRSHPFRKNNYTKFYRRWRHRVEPYIQPDGSVLRASPDEMEQRFRPGDAVTRPQSAGSVWTPITMNTYAPGTDAVLPWQANVYTFAISRSNPNILVCATEPGALFRTTDKGRNWTQIGKEYELSTEALAIDPKNPNTIYVVARGAIRKTTDAGTTWGTVLTRSDLRGYRIEVVPTSTSIVIASTDQGIFRTTDAGGTWTQILTTPSCDLALDATNPANVYALQYDDAKQRYEFWKSADFGATFTVRSNGWYPDTSKQGGRLAVTAADPRRIYAVLLTPGGPRILRSDDMGESWSVTAHGGTDALAMTNGQGYYDLAILASPIDANDLIVATTTAYKSTDGGLSFAAMGGYTGPFPIHPDIQDMRAFGGDAWIATDGGLTYSTDFFTDPGNAEARVRGLNGSDFWGFDTGWNDDVMVGGRYHNGNTAITEKYGGRFMRMGGGEAATGYVNPIRSNMTYYSDIGGYIIPDTFANVFTSIPVARWPNESYWQMWYSRMVWDPICYNRIWIGNGNTLWRSDNGGLRYDSIVAVEDSTAWIEHIEIARSNPRVIYVTEHNTARYDARIWRSSDGGATWDSLPQFPGTTGSERRQMKIALSGTDENELWGALAYGPTNGKVFHSTDGGRTWGNLTTATIRDVSIFDILHQIGTDGGVYISCNGGRVFYRNNAMEDWQPYYDGLWIGHYARALKPFYRDGKLRSGSNLGIWEIPFYEPSKPVAMPTVDKLRTECPRDTFYFGDYSALKYEGERWQWAFPGASYVSSTTDRDPRVVYDVPGKYSVALTVANAYGTSTRTIEDMIEVGPNECRIDSLPMAALDLGSSTDRVTAGPMPGLAGATSFTLSAWIKLDGTQTSFSQIVSNWSSNVGFSFGFAFLGYRANTNLTFYWRGVPYQLTSPFDLDTLVWTHVAITVEPDRVTLYRNGQPWVYKGEFTGFDLASTPFEIGGGLPGQGGNFQGEIDEVKFYDRALSAEEIRKRMHLIAPEGEPGLVAYYQFDESSHDRIYDRVGAVHAVNGGGVRIASTVPVAVGTSARARVTGAGRTEFGGTGVSIRYGDSPSYPDDDVVAYRLYARPDTLPTGMNQFTGNYWIVRTWGTIGAGTDTLVVSGIGRMSEEDSDDVEGSFGLLGREANEHLDTWRLLPNRALRDYPRDGNALAFEFPGGSLPYGQFIIGTRGTSVLDVPAVAAVLPSPGITAVPNPTAGLVTLRFRSDGADRRLQVVVSDIVGRTIERREVAAAVGGEQSVSVDVSDLPTGVYILRVDGRSVLVVRE